MSGKKDLISKLYFFSVAEIAFYGNNKAMLKLFEIIIRPFALSHSFHLPSPPK